MRDNIIQIKSFEFGVKIISLYVSLKKDQDFIISKQVLRAGTSIGANVNEAIEAQSRKDFIHKMSLALKESRETLYWISLLKATKKSHGNLDEMITQLEEIIRILTKIILTSKSNLNK
jgi:four helix bundle protein